MNFQITRVMVQYEHDVVYARQRAHTIAELLGFDRIDRTRISTAVSEIARNAYQYASGGEIEFGIDIKARPQILTITCRDRGPGIQNLDDIIDGGFSSTKGLGIGLSGTRRLMDHFYVETGSGKGTTVFLGKNLPPSAPLVAEADLAKIADFLIRMKAEDAFQEIRDQNQELLSTLAELEEHRDELERLNRELQDVNRGMLALYAELDEKAHRLKEVNDLKARFLSNMTHEFRTPLNSILGLSRLLLDRVDGDLTTEQEKQITFIRKAAEDLSGLVNDLLDLAKIEAGKVTIHPKKIFLADIVSGLRGMLRPLLVSDSIKLTFEDPPEDLALFTDGAKVSQILRNFISNAIKFTEAGEIRVWTDVLHGGRMVRFYVSDTGIGIPYELQQWIFEEYTQVEGAVKSDIKGTGLGLPISKKLAEMFGGGVGVKSEPGKGSLFWADIPSRYGEPMEEGEKEALFIDTSRLPVLVVEDDPATLLLYEKYLKGSGFQVLSAENLEEAARILSTVKPAAVLLDILICGEEAWQFLSDFKASEATRHIPVIVISILDEEDKGLALGAEDYCVKPVERKWLLAKLRNLSDRGAVEKVLIIDDEEVPRYILKGLLADTRYRILEASDGIEGLEAAERERPDVIFLDLVMPGMSGFEVLQKLKANPATQHIPVIINTSKVLDETERSMLKNQVIGILSKEASSRESAVMKVRDILQKAFMARGSAQLGKESPNA